VVVVVVLMVAVGLWLVFWGDTSRCSPRVLLLSEVWVVWVVSRIAWTNARQGSHSVTAGKREREEGGEKPRAKGKSIYN